MTIAIVGCGASCVILLHEILHEVEKFRSVNIVIYEKNNPDGKGIAYSVADGSFILNTSPKCMSVNRKKENDYIDWCRQYEKNKFLRVSYGEYLTYSLKKVSDDLIALHVNVVTRQETISSLDLHQRNVIIKTDRAIYRADFCIIASGGCFSNPYPYLQHCPGYIESINHLEGFDIKDASAAAGIIGSNQSAVDAALYLKDKGYRGKIYMFSNRGLLPKVKQETDAKPPLTTNLYKLVAVEKQFTLDVLIEAFKADMADAWNKQSLDEQIKNVHNLDWRVFLFDIRKAKMAELTWQKLMEQLSPFIHDIWLYLTPEERNLFLSKYYHHVTRLRGAIPLYNGEKILKLVQSKEVMVIKRITAIEHDKNFIITDGNHLNYQVNYLINATGINKKGPIKHLELLFKKGIATVSENGGVKVDLVTNQLITTQGERLTNLYAIGYPTSGTFLFVNSIELLRVHAQKIASQLTLQLQYREVGTSLLM